MTLITIERTLVAYNLGKVLKYADKQGYINIRDLQEVFGYNHFSAAVILSELLQMGLIRPDDWKAVRGDSSNTAYRSYVLTKVGSAVKDFELRERGQFFAKSTMLENAIMTNKNSQLPRK